jgi:hypothetical protein
MRRRMASGIPNVGVRSSGHPIAISRGPTGFRYDPYVRSWSGGRRRRRPRRWSLWIDQPNQTRFVRLQGVKSAGSFGYSLWELEVCCPGRV